ncbi:hypothetical protein KOW79_008201 [Hemibagrus wyckioides]|uniref:Uncharacterized protein n=1 Tax=Hemibagrus wyckioides TaxID=337641 RepID=A0A9D3NTV2_9TELE|nr:uncharacterized protein si:dkey-229e3.2 [Hemibagrus wyckioides]XP_058255223.1 uncharacterized protein si:dkey-229e3.2 [Hemibagrus wyckioides]XP_058255224.1 uncharacterized protein si:dkey-229e3.2 [Hemibagrus wyckioides]KAG7328257.1 hypothetical protein KOW79_008201 [Hemibagrus wyckioides]
MENLSEDGFERGEQFGDWSTCSSGHWDEDHRDSSGFGNWASFKEGLGEDTADVSTQEGHGHEHKEERDDALWTAIHNCFHVEEMVRETGMTDVLPLSQLLHNFTHKPPPPALILRKGASFYHRLLCEPKSQSITGPTKPNLYSHKQLTDTLQLKQTNTTQNTDIAQLGFEKPESSSPALIQTKLTSPTCCQNSPGFFYQISHQWLSQYSLRLQNHQGKKDLL